MASLLSRFLRSQLCGERALLWVYKGRRVFSFFWKERWAGEGRHVRWMSEEHYAERCPFGWAANLGVVRRCKQILENALVGLVLSYLMTQWGNQGSVVFFGRDAQLFWGAPSQGSYLAFRRLLFTNCAYTPLAGMCVFRMVWSSGCIDGCNVPFPCLLSCHCSFKLGVEVHMTTMYWFLEVDFSSGPRKSMALNASRLLAWKALNVLFASPSLCCVHTWGN